jgi:hypothetical protein
MKESEEIESFYEELEKLQLDDKRKIKQICEIIAKIKPFDSKLWKKYFIKWSENDFLRAKHLRKIIIYSTLECINPENLMYQLENGKEIIICTKEEILNQIQNTSKISHQEIEMIQIPKRLYENTNVEVMKKDCLVAAIELKDQGFNPLVLNMANEKTPGGY